MRIKELFVKDIYRNINGVIKVEQDDSEEVYQELDEYVLTKEMDRHFHDFFNSYVQSLDYKTDKIGVWVSGFFGSGKSHMIKILSYLLSNKRVDGKTALDFFQDKFQDDMLLSDIERVINKGTTDVILFNIDSKSDAADQTEKAKIVQVFMKVFNEMQGFCGEIPWLADLERELDRRGQYEEFKRRYTEITEQDWVENRETFYFDRDNIVKALADVTHMSIDSAEKWFDSGEENYNLSIEKFVKIVKEYCDSKGDHRVIFLVDEIGQYIGDNTELMLNLQTVTEDLGRMLQGKAWIVVTSQEAIDTITKLKGRDFSKIKGRFSTQLNLSSDNTDAVIKKRILDKRDASKDYLSMFYGEKAPIIRNLISFSANTAEMKSYKTEGEFAEVYPFIPYQFNLVQKVFEQIRRIGASGAHLSEGERSMLSAFQEAGKMIAEEDIGKLVPFSYFYKSVETFLHSGIKRTINQAYDNSRLKDEDCELLKVLFMIKYIKEIRPNVENLTTLSITHIDEDKIVLRKRIQESLERLKVETLINQSGDEYEFLTDEEQDIEREIKSIEIEERNIIDYVGDIVFTDIYKDKKYKYSSHNQYSFNILIDGVSKGSQGHELTVKVMTPWDENYSNSSFNMIMGSTDSVIIKLPDDDVFLEEIKKISQIRKFILRKSSLKNSETIQKIIDGKSTELHKIKDRIKLLIGEAVVKSEVFLCGDKVDVKGGNAKDVISNALGLLVKNIYSKVDYIKNHTPYIENIQEILSANDLELFGKESWEGNKLAENEVKSFIERQQDRSLKTTVKIIKDRYSKKPYGWADGDIAGILAFLFVQGDILFKYNHEYVRDKKEIPDYLMKRDYAEKVLIEPRSIIDPVILTRVRKLMVEAFGVASLPDDQDGLFNKTKETISKGIQKIREYKMYYSRPGGELYPGKDIIDEGVEVLSKIDSVNNEGQFFDILLKHKDDLLDLSDDIEPVKGFFDSQIKVFDKALGEYEKFLSDKNYLDNSAKANLDEMNKIFHMREPYRKIKELPLLAEKVRDAHSKVLEDYRVGILDKIDSVSGDIRDVMERNKEYLSDAFCGSILSLYDRLKKEADMIKDCVKLKAFRVEIDEYKQVSLRQIDRDIEKNKIEAGDDGGKPEAVKEIEHIKISEFGKWNRVIEDSDDLDKYISQLKNKLEKILEEDKKIRFV